MVLRIAAGLGVAALSPGFPKLYDGSDYRELAAAVASDRGLSISSVRWFEAPRPREPTPEAFRPPLLPFLSGWLVNVKPDSFARLLAFQGALAALLAGVVSFLLLPVAGPRAAWLGLLLCSAHPLLLYYSTCFSTEILFSLCLASFIWSWVWDSPWRWPTVGFVIALATLARPTAVLLLPLSLLAVLGAERHRRLASACSVTLAFFVTMSPWMIRNQRAYGEPRLTNWYGGYVFWLGNNRFNLEAYRARSDTEFLNSQGRAWAEGIRMAKSMQEPRYRHPREQEQFWIDHGWADIQAYGLKAWLRLLAGKAWHFLRPWPLAGAHDPALFWLAAASETALFALGAAGLAALWRLRSRVLVPLLLLLFTGTLAHTLTFGYMRHRVPYVDLVMLIGASTWLGAIPTRASAAPGPGRR